MYEKPDAKLHRFYEYSSNVYIYMVTLAENLHLNNMNVPCGSDRTIITNFTKCSWISVSGAE
jgi:hypothetical protein